MAEWEGPKKFGCLTATKITVRENGEHIYALAFSPDQKYLAATFSNGCLSVFDANSFERLGRSKVGAGFDEIPSTGVAWRPRQEDDDEGVYDLVSISSGGALFFWNFDVTDAENIYLDKVAKIVEEGNETAAVDYSPDGAIVATAGSDRAVRTYDAKARKLIAKLEHGHDDAGHVRPAHTNRIFSLKFASDQIILTGGWQAPIQGWDLKTGHSERQIVGAAISSDGIEVTRGSQQFLTVSKRDTNQIQAFDFVSGRENTTDSERLSANVGKNALTQIRFSPDTNLVWTATTKPDSLLCLDFASGKVKGIVDSGALGTILCLQVSPAAPKRVFVGAMNEGLYAVECE